MLRNLGSDLMYKPVALVMAGGLATVAGLITHASTFNDGTQRSQDGRHGPTYQLTPNSQDAARASINKQRLFAGAAAVIGGGVLGVAFLGGPTIRPVVAGALALGIGLGAFVKLSGAEKNIDTALPQHTKTGTPDMTRHNKYQYQQDGAGYNAYGVYQGATWGQSALSPTYRRSDLDAMMPTVPNWLQPSSYFGGNVDPRGPRGVGVPTGISDANALSRTNAANYASDQRVLEHLRAVRTPSGQ